jgi:uncharacterized cupin superfamily protein
MDAKKEFLLKAEEIVGIPEFEAHHPLNSDSEAYIRSLSHEVGLEQIGVHITRLPPGKEANAYHTHTYEEEFYYVLSGRGVILFDGQEYEVGEGDFAGFKPSSAPHLLRNPFDRDLVYLVGGERRAFEIAEFPEHGRTMIRDSEKAWVVENDALQVIWRKDPEAE